MTAVGIDWGPAVTRLATWGRDGRPLRSSAAGVDRPGAGLPIGPVDAGPAVASMLTYRGTGVRLGRPPQDDPADRVVTGADLHHALEGDRGSVAGLAVEDAIGHFFGLLLQAGPESVRHRYGAPQRAILAVPHRWLSGRAAGGSHIRQRLDTVLSGSCRLPLAGIVSAPVAALAYLVATGRPDLPAVPELVVICDLSERAVEVTAFQPGPDVLRPVGADYAAAPDHHAEFIARVARMIGRVIEPVATATAPIGLMLIGGRADLDASRQAIVGRLWEDRRIRTDVIGCPEPARVVSYGAAALAAEAASATAFLEPGLALGASAIRDGQSQNAWLDATGMYGLRAGQAAPVLPEPLVLDEDSTGLDLLLRWSNGVERLSLPLVPAAPPGRYQVMFRLDPDGLALVLRDEAEGVTHRYPVLPESARQEASR